MKKNITNQLVSRLKPGEKEYEVRDTDLKGLVLRVMPTGRMIYSIVYKRGKRITLGKADVITPFQARELGKSVLAKVYKGEDPIGNRKQAKAENYLQFLEEPYKPWLVRNVSYGQATFENLKKSFPEFHNLSLNEITPGLIEKWRMRRLEDGLKASTINRQMNDLRACLNRAINTWELLETNPFARVKPCKIDSSPKVRYLSKDEELALYQKLDAREQAIKDARDSANEWRADRGHPMYASLQNQAYVDYLKPAVLLSLHTGLRRGELFSLKWEDVDLEQKHLTVTAETTKTGKTRHVPLNAEALAILKKWKKQPGLKSNFVFHGKDGAPFHDVETSWAGVLEKAKIVNFRWHDLRHTFASKLVMAGVDLNTVRELLGHSDYKMTLRYAHLAPEHKAAAVNKLVAPAIAR